jgi:hypothetical protein
MRTEPFLVDWLEKHRGDVSALLQPPERDNSTRNDAAPAAAPEAPHDPVRFGDFEDFDLLDPRPEHEDSSDDFPFLA